MRKRKRDASVAVHMVVGVALLLLPKQLSHYITKKGTLNWTFDNKLWPQLVHVLVSSTIYL